MTLALLLLFVCPLLRSNGIPERVSDLLLRIERRKTPLFLLHSAEI
jgi:hypothetical protein